MGECGQVFGGLGQKAACPLGNQQHRCTLAGTHEGACVCDCGAIPKNNSHEGNE